MFPQVEKWGCVSLNLEVCSVQVGSDGGDQLHPPWYLLPVQFLLARKVNAGFAESLLNLKGLLEQASVAAPAKAD